MELVKPKVLLSCPECGTILSCCAKCKAEFVMTDLVMCDDSEIEHYHERCLHESVD